MMTATEARKMRQTFAEIVQQALREIEETIKEEALFGDATRFTLNSTQNLYRSAIIRALFDAGYEVDCPEDSTAIIRIRW